MWTKFIRQNNYWKWFSHSSWTNRDYVTSTENRQHDTFPPSVVPTAKVKIA